MIKKIVLSLLVGAFVIMQFWRIDKTNPPVVESKTLFSITQPPEAVQSIVKSACFDCHSNETVYPWYSDIAPVSWWIKGHIDHARSELNFSEWGDLSEESRNKMIKKSHRLVRNNLMPMASYVMVHQEARLTPPQKKLLLDWLQSQVPDGLLNE
jgi:hypothetical protein